MNVQLSQRAIEQLAAAPLPVQKAFIKQINFLARNLGIFDASESRRERNPLREPFAIQGAGFVPNCGTVVMFYHRKKRLLARIIDPFYLGKSRIIMVKTTIS